MKKFLSLVAVLAVAVCTGEAFAQTSASASQKFTVSVPTSVSITAPADVSLTHDQTDNNQAFPAQSWAVRGNVGAGVSVSFATNQAFTNLTDSSFKRNAKLDLAIASHTGPATWNVSKATDTTDYAGNNGVASVQASSNGVGKANFNLTVSFITDTFGSFLAGDYVTTVTGTVTAN